MSGFNEVMLAGFVFTAPVEVDNEDEGYYKTVIFEITVERADVLNRADVLTLKCYNEVAIKALKELKEGDYFVGETVHLRTKNYMREIESICPNCQEVKIKKTSSEKTEIVVDSYINMKKVFPKSLFGVNRIMLFGNACSVVDSFKLAGGAGKTQSKFKMAVDRHGKEKRVQKADYPFVVSYGAEADYLASDLNKGNMLIVKGAIQERRIKQKYSEVCEACNTAYNFEVENKIVEVGCIKSEVLKSIKGKTQEELTLDENEVVAVLDFVEEEYEEDFDMSELEDLFEGIE